MYISTHTLKGCSTVSVPSGNLKGKLTDLVSQVILYLTDTLSGWVKGFGPVRCDCAADFTVYTGTLVGTSGRSGECPLQSHLISLMNAAYISIVFIADTES